MDHLFQRQNTFLLDKIVDCPWEGGSGTRMALFIPCPGDSVSTHQAVGTLNDLAHILIAHTGIHRTGGTVVLYTDIEEYNESDDAVVMMTMHSAKGLEFPVVFLCGMAKQFNQDMCDLLEGKTVELPYYNFNYRDKIDIKEERQVKKEWAFLKN